MSSDPHKAGPNAPGTVPGQSPQRPGAGKAHAAPESLDLEWEAPEVPDTLPPPVPSSAGTAQMETDDLEEVDLDLEEVDEVEELEMVDLDESIEAAPVAPQATPAAAPAPAAKGVTCNHCGHVQPTDEKFCDACGLRIDKTGTFVSDEEEETVLEIDEDGDKVLCLECGVRNKPGLKLCINCGGRLIPDEII